MKFWTVLGILTLVAPAGLGQLTERPERAVSLGRELMLLDAEEMTGGDDLAWRGLEGPVGSVLIIAESLEDDAWKEMSATTFRFDESGYLTQQFVEVQGGAASFHYTVENTFELGHLTWREVTIGGNVTFTTSYSYNEDALEGVSSRGNDGTIVSMKLERRDGRVHTAVFTRNQSGQQQNTVYRFDTEGRLSALERGGASPLRWRVKHADGKVTFSGAPGSSVTAELDEHGSIVSTKVVGRAEGGAADTARSYVYDERGNWTELEISVPGPDGKAAPWVRFHRQISYRK